MKFTSSGDLDRNKSSTLFTRIGSFKTWVRFTSRQTSRKLEDTLTLFGVASLRVSQIMIKKFKSPKSSIINLQRKMDGKF